MLFSSLGYNNRACDALWKNFGATMFGNNRACDAFFDYNNRIGATMFGNNWACDAFFGYNNRIGATMFGNNQACRNNQACGGFGKVVALKFLRFWQSHTIWHAQWVMMFDISTSWYSVTMTCIDILIYFFSTCESTLSNNFWEVKVVTLYMFVHII